MSQHFHCLLLLLFFLNHCLSTHNVISAHVNSRIMAANEKYYNFPSLNLKEVELIKKSQQKQPNNILNIACFLVKKVIVFIVLPVISYLIFSSSKKFEDLTQIKIPTPEFTKKRWWMKLSSITLAIGDAITTTIGKAWFWLINFGEKPTNKLTNSEPSSKTSDRRTTLVANTGSTLIASREVVVISSNYITLLILFTVALFLGAYFYWKKRVLINQYREKGVTRRTAKRRQRKRH